MSGGGLFVVGPKAPLNRTQEDVSQDRGEPKPAHTCNTSPCLSWIREAAYVAARAGLSRPSGRPKHTPVSVNESILAKDVTVRLCAGVISCSA